MADEENVTTSSIPPAATDTGNEPSSEGNGTVAADVSTAVPASESVTDGAEQAAGTEGALHDSQSK